MHKLLAIILCSASLLTGPAYAQTISAEQAVINPRNVFELLYTDAEAEVGRALNEKGVGEKLAVTITGRKNRVLYAYEQPLTVEIRGLQFDKRDSRWSASLLFVADGKVISALPASGRYEEIIEIPVLKREIRSGNVITETDIEVRDFSVAQTRSDTVTDISGLIGKSPIHSISPSRPIRGHEIGYPAIVKKNSLVEMQYNSPGMSITTSGQALSDGAKGDVINVRNSTSKKIVRAVVADSRTVLIIGAGMQTSELTGVGHAAN